ncbi:MAG: hypothetical protein UT32_C0015G0002 [Parcubacteria group bacterium GW2011_GWC2_39_14]|nr:MAG: hypothetical protein UT32_C0015G0002 [Parcubacteria group bacterium GW2011_GWC2_39_14]KKR54398.1 MAG: hypothetical protein UT91_C0016G0002 [Parcubacteria group bacterium GW2011_GWA2_40_23]
MVEYYKKCRTDFRPPAGGHTAPHFYKNGVAVFDNLQFFNELIITHSHKFFKPQRLKNLWLWWQILYKQKTVHHFNISSQRYFTLRTSDWDGRFSVS